MPRRHQSRPSRGGQWHLPIYSGQTYMQARWGGILADEELKEYDDEWQEEKKAYEDALEDEFAASLDAESAASASRSVSPSSPLSSSSSIPSPSLPPFYVDPHGVAHLTLLPKPKHWYRNLQDFDSMHSLLAAPSPSSSSSQTHYVLQQIHSDSKNSS